jgi:hypothetical protein
MARTESTSTQTHTQTLSVEKAKSGEISQRPAGTQVCNESSFTMATNNAASPQERHFRLFPNLPFDIRLEIWKHSMHPMARIIGFEDLESFYKNFAPRETTAKYGRCRFMLLSRAIPSKWRSFFPRKLKLFGPASEGLRPEITELLFCHEGPIHAGKFLREQNSAKHHQD